MSTAAPRIGMDRFVDAEWMELAAGVVRGELTIKGMHERLASDIPGDEVRKKTTGILNRMWFPTDPSACKIATSAAGIVRDHRESRAAAFQAVSIAAYPYFRQVIEHVGRLIRLQGSCTAGEVHRRMFELHGKRSTIDQATSYAFKTLVSWSMLARDEEQRLICASPINITTDVKRLLDAAANISRHSVSPLNAADPLLFPFNIIRK
ncbi:hypothetical protein [Sphingomonas melonis]